MPKAHQSTAVPWPVSSQSGVHAGAGRVRTRVADDLGGQILGRAAERVGLSILYLLCKAKVDQLEVALGVDEDVLGLQVAVGDALALV
jgi:hypothetical protein